MDSNVPLGQYMLAINFIPAEGIVANKVRAITINAATPLTVETQQIGRAHV